MSMTVISGRCVNVTLFTSLPCSELLCKSACSQLGFWKILPAACSSEVVTLKASSAARAISLFVAPAARLALATSAAPLENSSGDVRPEDTTRQLEKVVISTTKTSRTARVISGESEYIADRYVKGSLTYQIELSRSICLEEIASEETEDDDISVDEESTLDSSGPEETLTTATVDLWTSETYVRRYLEKRLMSKEVMLRFPTEDPSIYRRRPRNEHLDGSELVMDTPSFYSGRAHTEMLTDEEEFFLRRALKEKRLVAEEILQGSLEAAGLGPTYTKDVMSFMSLFIDRIISEAVALKKYRINKDLSFNSRARLFIRDSKVVELVKWLKHNRMTAPRIGSLISTAHEYLGRIRSRVEWLKTIYVTGRDLGVVLERQPRILKLSLSELKGTVQLLETAGVQRMWLGLIVSRAPRVLTLSKRELEEKISMFTDLGLSPERFGVMVYNVPAVLGRFSVQEMQSKVEYLQKMGMNDDVLAKIIGSTPQLLACSIEDSWSKLLRYFYFLRIQPSGVRRILAVQPAVFCLNLADNIAPKVKFLLAIGVHEEAVGQLLVDFPAFLTYSLDKKIRPVVRFLLEEAGVTEEKVGKVISLQPELIRCSLPNKLQVLVKFFRSKGIRAHHIGAMVADFPSLLMYSMAVVQPKFLYMIQVMKRPLDDIVIFPRCFSYSLNSRIIPRHELLADKGLTFSLRHMLACSDDTFKTRVAEAEIQLSERYNTEAEGPFGDHQEISASFNGQDKSLASEVVEVR